LTVVGDNIIVGMIIVVDRTAVDQHRENQSGLSTLLSRICQYSFDAAQLGCRLFSITGDREAP
jgi:hypothetical protein